MHRSNDQGEYYFGVLIPEAISYYEANQLELMRDMVRYFETKSGQKFAFSKEFIHEVFKMIFNDGASTKFKDFTLPSGELIKGTQQMSDYWDRIREHFLHDKNFLIPNPNEGKI